MAKKTSLEKTKGLMAALLGMKPKHHEDMKLGGKKKRTEKKAKNSSTRRG
jgi:hypothetical protein